MHKALVADWASVATEGKEKPQLPAPEAAPLGVPPPEPTTFTDEHTLNIDTGSASREEIAAEFKAAVGRAEARLGVALPYKYVINVPVKNSGENFGFCYLFVSAPAVYRVALGLAPDGGPGEPFEISYKVKPCIVWPPEPGLRHDVLRSTNVPDGATEDDVRRAFAPFATSGGGYPTVEFVRPPKGADRGKTGRAARLCLVSFDPATRDAQFALNMRKKFALGAGGRQTQVYFALAQSADFPDAPRAEAGDKDRRDRRERGGRR